MKSVIIFISLLIMLCPAFSQSRMEHYLDSLGLVNVGRMDPTLKIDLMYTRADNFTGKVLYEDLQEAYLHPEAAKALLQAQKRLKELYPGYSLIIYDAARPMSVQQKMWNVVKGTSQNIYVSNPARGGGLHNYGDQGGSFGQGSTHRYRGGNGTAGNHYSAGTDKPFAAAPGHDGCGL